MSSVTSSMFLFNSTATYLSLPMSPGILSSSAGRYYYIVYKPSRVIFLTNHLHAQNISAHSNQIYFLIHYVTILFPGYQKSESISYSDVCQLRYVPVQSYETYSEHNSPFTAGRNDESLGRWLGTRWYSTVYVSLHFTSTGLFYSYTLS